MTLQVIASIWSLEHLVQRVSDIAKFLDLVIVLVVLVRLESDGIDMRIVGIVGMYL